MDSTYQHSVCDPYFSQYLDLVFGLNDKAKSRAAADRPHHSSFELLSNNLRPYPI